ncbi:MAG: homoserine dehydrogenase [Clostridiales bacterium]|jgi:homoserine dehydrogenase|nr:homoserine dehydrogenase [Clostridiales bacterium]
MKIAILGFGVVGSGVAEVLKTNKSQITKKAGQEIEIKYIMDLRDFAGEPFEHLMTKDFGAIENDPEVEVVVESIGGDTIAYEYTKRALLSGKNVCTPNKALIAKHGAELFSIAKERGVHILFEASVGGGIPLIRPYNDALLTDEVEEVSGILNGTSNYILTQMMNGTSYENALKDAQELGYAEQDPTADVGSFDACRKLAIMLSLAVNKQVNYEEIKTEGIQEINSEDFAFAKALGFTLKQLVNGSIRKNGVEALAAPFLIPLSHPLASVNDVFNGVWVRGKTTGNIMLYGSGAGKLPTASAVVTNIVDIAAANCLPCTWTSDKANILPTSTYAKRKAIRASFENANAISAVKSAIGAETVSLPDYPNTIAWLTPLETEAQTAQTLEVIKRFPGFKSIERVMRVYNAE